MTETNPALRPNISDRNFGLAEFKSRRWRGELLEGQSIKDALDPVFWRHQVDKVAGHTFAGGRGDIIELYKPDTAEYVELLIVEIGKGFIKTRQISHSAPPEEVPVLATDHAPLTTKWNPGKRSHDVIRKSDGGVMSSGHQTKQSAADWIADHLKSMAA